MRDAGGLIIVGSDSPSYSASKLYPYLFARKPIIAVLHQDSPAVKILRDAGMEDVVTFEPSHLAHSHTLMAQALRRFRTMVQNASQPELNESELSRYRAVKMARRQAEVFERAVNLEAQ